MSNTDPTKNHESTQVLTKVISCFSTKDIALKSKYNAWLA